MFYDLFLVVLSEQNAWHFLKFVSFELKFLDYFQPVWHILVLNGAFEK